MSLLNAERIKVWRFKDDSGDIGYMLPEGSVFFDKEGKINKYGKYVHSNLTTYFKGLEEDKKTYEQLETEARIKKLEWTIAEQQLEIERLRQKELELSKGKNNE